MTEQPPRARQVATCPVTDVPVTAFTVVAGGRVLLTRVRDDIVAYRNACLHKGSRLDRGVVRDGTITCPQHLWRYRLSDGACLNAPGALRRLPARVVDGHVHVELPPPDPGSIRDVLLAHARSWKRDP